MIYVVFTDLSVLKEFSMLVVIFEYHSAGILLFAKIIHHYTFFHWLHPRIDLWSVRNAPLKYFTQVRIDKEIA